jgi:3-deoxy-D-manno-octulosonate 8-phosphate phosphatase (KDO 8-P phosphatase)
MAVADAATEVKAAACWISSATGGHGAVREAVEHLLRAAGAWGSVVERFA